MKDQNQKKSENIVKQEFRNLRLLYGAKDWAERSAQGIEGLIVKVHGKYMIDVEILQLPGNSVAYDPVCDVELNDSLLNRQVVGDLGSGGFIVRVLCFDDVVVGE